MSNRNFISVGYENYIDAKRIVAVLSIDSSPAKKLVRREGEAGALIDVTSGRRRKSVVLLDNHNVLITAKNPMTIIKSLYSDADNEKEN